MKPIAALLTGSVALNVVLIATVLARPALVPQTVWNLLPGFAPAAPAASQAPPAPRPTAGRTAPLWSALGSSDLPTLIAQLRAAGFPPAVIQAIAAARIEGQFTSRLRALAAQVENVPFWRPGVTSMNNHTRFFEERTQIYRERTRQLRELLGQDFLAAASPEASAQQQRQYGQLPPAKIALVERINDDYAEMTAQVRAAANGIILPEDREKLALLEREKRADLAAILTPQELEDYEMRSSPITQRLRSAMTWMNATEEEFRTVFRLHQQLGDPLSYTMGLRNPVNFQERRERDQRLASAIASALGGQRAAEYERAQHYEFQQLARIVQREQRDLQAAITAFDLRAAAAAGSVRIHDDRSLAPDQKLAAMRTLAQKTREQLTETLGATAGKAYADSANWLQAIESGRAVSFSGTATMYRSAVPSSPPPP
ncbi:MAG: hypothetical protein JNL92_19740 [Opitutaceae bacterium]|nr:hypothetical protein [Opitutaceae bacterium]